MEASERGRTEAIQILQQVRFHGVPDSNLIWFDKSKVVDGGGNESGSESTI